MKKTVILLCLLGTVGMKAETRTEPASKALGETYMRTRAPEDRAAWYDALEREKHDFSKRYRSPIDSRGVYKLNRRTRLASIVLRKTEKSGDSWDEDLGADGRLHLEWTRKANGGIDYKYTAPTNWDVFVSAYPGAVTRYGVKIMKTNTGTNDPMPRVELPEGWRVVEGEAYSGVNVRETYLTFEKDGVRLPPPQVTVVWPNVGVRAVHGATNVALAVERATFVPSARKPPTTFATGLPGKGVISCSLMHHLRGMQAGPYRGVPYPENEIRAVPNFVYGMKSALVRLGFGEKDALRHGRIWLGGFDSNFPNGHTDFPAHFHICVNCRDGNQVHHFYMAPETGRITWDCFQDMNSVLDTWDVVTAFRPVSTCGAKSPVDEELCAGDRFHVYDGCGRVAFTVKLLADGVGFEFARPGNARAVRVCGTRPCEALDVLEQDGDAWRKVETIRVTDDPVRGVLVTPDGEFRYDPDTGSRR